jgi:phosphonate transport system substrate-binding protein
LPFIELEKKYSDVVPLVNFKNKNGDISYTCSFVSFITNNFLPEGMKNTKIALTQAL